MDYLIVATVCFAGGGFAMYVALDVKRRRLEQLRCNKKAGPKTFKTALGKSSFKGRKLARIRPPCSTHDRSLTNGSFHTKSCKMKTDCSKPIYEILR